MTNRFFVDSSVSRWDSQEVHLAGDEAHHFSKVMRGKVGDSLILFDGSGRYASGIAESVQRGEVRVHIVETFADEVESPLRLTVASALPKGDRQRFLIEKLAELGAARFVPVQMENSVARANDAVVQRLRRYVIEAAKQCGRNVLMEITDEVPIAKLNSFLDENVSDKNKSASKFILHPVALGEAGQTTAGNLLPQILTDLSQPVIVLVGPEGSFADHEVRLMLQEGFHALDLGKRILRTETACIAAAALLLTSAG